MTNRQTLLNNIKTNMENIIYAFKEYDIETLFSLYDLKLYNVISLNNFDEDIFNCMCQCEYDNFMEFLEENNCATRQLGRTSKFWVTSDYTSLYTMDLETSLSEGLNFKIQLLVNAFVNEYISSSLEITINKDFTFTYDDCITDVNWYDVEDLEILSDLFTDYEKDLQEFIEYNIIKPLDVIDYINETKANQIAIYNAYYQE